MERKMKLIKALLSWTEANAKGESLPVPEIEGYTGCEIGYHVDLCVQAGYLRATDLSTSNRRQFRIRELTWAGHEALTAFRAA